MIKRALIPTNNTSYAAEFVSKGAQKRRSMAMTSARMISAEMGITPRLIAVK